MQASRLLSILMLLLQSRGRLTAGALAQALEVSPRTILRDIDQLSAAGVPLWGERCRAGGFQLRAGRHTARTGMTEPEARALLLAGLPGPATALGLGAAAASARLKLVASLPPPWREQAERVGARLHIDPLDWHRAEDAPAFLQEAAQAVWQARRLRLDYESWRGRATHALEPLGLVLKAGAWYLVARRVGEAEPRTWRLASMRDLAFARGTFRRPRHFDLVAHWQAPAARFEAGMRPLQARVRVSPRGLAWLRNARLPHALAAPDAPADDTAWQVVRLPIESVAHGTRQLLGLGTEVQAIAPAALRREVARPARAMLGLHEAPARPARL